MASTATRSTHTGRYVVLVFREGRFVKSVGVIKRRIVIGSATWCDVVLDDPSVPARWGEIVDKGLEVLLQPDGGPPRRFPLLETFEIGPFVLVRVDAKVHVPSVAREIEVRLS